MLFPGYGGYRGVGAPMLILSSISTDICPFNPPADRNLLCELSREDQVMFLSILGWHDTRQSEILICQISMTTIHQFISVLLVSGSLGGNIKNVLAPQRPKTQPDVKITGHSLKKD